MYVVATSIPSCASISEVIMIVSSDTVGYAASYFLCATVFFLPLSHVLPLIMTSILWSVTSGAIEPLTCPSWSVY